MFDNQRELEDEATQEMATVPDAIREWARVEGADAEESQWILSDYDTWVLNPYYRGPDQGHPDDDAWQDGQDED